MVTLHSILLVFLLRRVSPQLPPPEPCSETCGGLRLPFPFHLDPSCGPSVDAFRLTCRDDSLNSSGLFLRVGTADLRVLGFSPTPDGTLLVEFPARASSSSPCDRRYSDMTAPSPFYHNVYFGIAPGNFLRLYDCEDSSVCRTGCEKVGRGLVGCEGNGSFSGCCYTLLDGSLWKPGDNFSVFSESGCRGFSSWALRPDGGREVAFQGIEIEWAIPKGYRDGKLCAEGAVMVNSIAVEGGLRCACASGFVGDGFAEGSGCSRSCETDVNTTDEGKCCTGGFCKKKKAFIAGILVSFAFIAVVAAFCVFMRCPIKAKRWELDPSHLSSIIGRSSHPKEYTYEELSEATGRFVENKSLADSADGTTHIGILSDGSHVAVQKIRCDTEQDFFHVVSRLEFLSQISHKNITSILGYCFASSNALLLVHEFCANGTLEELLQKGRGIVLSWFHRISIVTEVANVLAHLQFNIHPPVYIRGLKSADILVDLDFSVKITTCKISKTRFGDGFCSFVVPQDSHEMFNFGLLLMEIITGSRAANLPEMILPRLDDGSLLEIVDPFLLLYELTPRLHEQVVSVVRLAERCLSSGHKDERCILEVAKDLGHLMKHHTDGINAVPPELEQTLSGSSLLQMISTSPDLHIP